MPVEGIAQGGNAAAAAVRYNRQQAYNQRDPSHRIGHRSDHLLLASDSMFDFVFQPGTERESERICIFNSTQHQQQLWQQLSVSSPFLVPTFLPSTHVLCLVDFFNVKDEKNLTRRERKD